MTIEFQPVGETDPALLAALLEARHEAHRAVEPLLAAIDSAAAVRDVVERGGAVGVAAVRDGEVIGYLVAELCEDPLWGRHAWVDRAGHAAGEPEIVRDMYAAVAPAWVEAGASMHLPLVPAVGRLLEPWYGLGFGRMQQHAIRESGGREPVMPDGATIRAAGKSDLERVARELGTLVWDHQMLAPTFSGASPLDPARVVEDWLEVFDDPTDALFVAERGESLLGHVLLHRASPVFGIPENAAELALMAVAPSARGLGIGVALSDHACRWAAGAGYGSITIDWRSTNLLSSRFWPNRGFRPTFHRMHRTVAIG